MCLRSIPACAGEPLSSMSKLTGRWVYPRVCGGTATEAAGEYNHTGYPRVGGGTRPYRRLPCWTLGLSPRVRGNRSVLVNHRVARGSIPACAGEPARVASGRAMTAVYPRVCGGTRRVYGVVALCGVYPRVCGGTRICRGLCRGAMGLSPRVRGNRLGGYRHRDMLGSIPACAGEPRPARSVAP